MRPNRYKPYRGGTGDGDGASMPPVQGLVGVWRRVPRAALRSALGFRMSALQAERFISGPLASVADLDHVLVAVGAELGHVHAVEDGGQGVERAGHFRPQAVAEQARPAMPGAQ